MEGSTGPIHFLNLEYFFRLLHNVLFGGDITIDPTGVHGLDATPVAAFAGGIWLIVTVVSIVVSVIALLILAYTFIRFRSVLHEVEHLVETLPPQEADALTDQSRWQHVSALIESPHESDWRQAVVEADIMLEEVLDEQGYGGNTIEEKLANVDPLKFRTIDEANKAHDVRVVMRENPIKPLEDQDAYRAIRNYELVFREFNTIEQS